DRFSLTRWRQRMGEEKLQALLQESLSVASKTEALKPSDLNRVIVDITVQPKNVIFPTRCAAAEPRPRDPGQAGETLWRQAAPVLCQAGQVRADQAPTLCPRQAVQARQQSLEEAQNLSRPHHPRHRPQTRW